MPTKTKTKPAARSAKPKPAVIPITLPEHMKLSPDEAALCARLIRVRRSGSWLRYYIEHLLHMDATSDCDVSPEQAKDALGAMDNFANWQQWVNPGALDEGEKEASRLVTIAEQSFSREERLEAELKAELAEIRANLESGHVVRFNDAAAEFARRIGKALERMIKENPPELE